MSETSESNLKDTPATRPPPRAAADDPETLESAVHFQSLDLSQVKDAVDTVNGRQHVTYLNQTAERLYGVTSARALGRPLRVVYKYRRARPAADGKEVCLQVLLDPNLDLIRGDHDRLQTDHLEPTLERGEVHARASAHRGAG